MTMSDIQLNKPSRVKWIITGGVIFIAGFIGAGIFNVILSSTNTVEFCTSCHTMQIPLDELKQSLHWSNRTGVHAGCADCHVPKSFFPKMVAKVKAAKDTWHQILGTIDTPEKYEQHRWEMANAVWEKMRATDSRECRSCHSYEHMNFEEQSKSAGKKHEAATTAKDKTCIDCHKGIAHTEPDEPEQPTQPTESAPPAQNTDGKTGGT
jgi:cytochrome c-type protein NapC